MSKETPQNNSSPRLSCEDWQELAIQVLKSCGYGRMLVIGLQDSELVCELLRHGVNVTGLATSPEAFSRIDLVVPGLVQTISPSALFRLDQNGSFDTVVLLAGSAGPDAWGVDENSLGRLIQSSRSVMLALFEGLDSHEALATWDQRFVSAGARRHPLSHEVAPYGSFDVLSGKMLLLYERMPEAARSKVLPTGSDIFSTRGFGVEEEARAARYELAARFVRSGDSVLDTASATGSGSYLLSRATAASIVGWNTDPRVVAYANASFASARATDLVFEQTPQHGVRSLASDTIDFIIADSDFGALDRQWDEARRVLTPGGRLYLCCPVRGSAGEDLSGTVRARLESSGLLLERCWLQHAQARQKNGAGGRRIEELLLESMSPSAGDWILLLAMKSIADYRSGMGNVVRDVHSPNVIAFTRDYENPWLVRGLVAMGLRATSATVRAGMAEDVLAITSENSVDHGAALCVQCYAELEKGSDAEVLQKWLERALAFATTPILNPTSVRWHISLLYVAGLMAMRIGNLAVAESAFSRIGDLDALKFSPLLGTKTVGAALRSGLIAFARGDNDSARQRWTRALLETHRLLRDGDWREVVVDIDKPETFGLPEVAAFVMEGARAAGGLRALQDFPDKPSLVWQALHGTQADVVQMQSLELRSLRHWFEDHNRQRDAWVEELDKGKMWLAQQSASWEAEARSKDEQIQSLTDQFAQLNEGKAWLEQQQASWEAEARSKDEQIRSLTDQFAQLNEGKAWLEQQQASWEAEARSKDEQVQSLTDQFAQLNEGKAWLEQQRASWEAIARSKDEQIQSLTDQFAQLNEGKAWLEQQQASWKAAVESKDRKMEEFAGHIGQLRDSLESAEHRLNSTQEALTASKQLEKSMALYNSQLLTRRLQLEQRIEAMHSEILVLAKTSADDSRRLQFIESSRLFRLGRKLRLVRGKE